jgi:hypothetical protein
MQTRNSGQWIGLLETEDGKCPFCGRPAASFDYCCRAKARCKVEMMLTAKRMLTPSTPLPLAGT